MTTRFLNVLDISYHWMSGAGPFVDMDYPKVGAMGSITDVYVTRPSNSGARGWKDLIKRSAQELTVAVLGGGSDIHPALYNHPNLHSHVGDRPSIRDQYEIEAIERCLEQDIPIIGICRGAQLLTAYAGGCLIQHVTNHSTSHKIEDTVTGEKLTVTSAHHQMCDPRNTEHKIWAVSAPNRSDMYVSAVDVPKDWVEPEVIFYPKLKAIAIQGHPEFTANDSAFSVYSRRLLTRMLEETGYEA